jgi:hypothetical protein
VYVCWKRGGLNRFAADTRVNMTHEYVYSYIYSTHTHKHTQTHTHVCVYDTCMCIWCMCVRESMWCECLRVRVYACIYACMQYACTYVRIIQIQRKALVRAQQIESERLQRLANSRDTAPTLNPKPETLNPKPGIRPWSGRIKSRLRDHNDSQLTRYSSASS